MTKKSTIGTAARNPYQEEQRVRTRRAITQAALKAFTKHGYVACSIEQILEQACVSRAAFYSHFDGKLATVEAIAADFEPEWQPVFRDLAALRDPNLEDLIEWASRHLRFHRENMETCSLLTQVAALEERLFWQISAQRDRLIDMLAEHHSGFAAAKSDNDIMLEARILLSGLDQTCFHIVRHHMPDPGQKASKIIANQMLNFLREPRG